jgi:hypothetical protein
VDGQEILRVIADTLTLTANGLLAVLYWLWDHAVTLGVIPLALVVMGHDRRAAAYAGQRVRRYDRGQVLRYSRFAAYAPTIGLAAAWMAAAWGVAFPVDLLGLLMWAALVFVPLVMPMERSNVVQRLKWFIGIYTGLALAFLVLLRAQLSPAALAAWSRTMGQQGGGQSLQVMVVDSLVPWAALILWGIYPAMFFGYIAERLHVHRQSLRAPWQDAAARITNIVGRGEA